jgi:hypothetical protein
MVEGMKMSEFNYTKCSKPFLSQDQAREFMVSKNFDGTILARSDGTFTAVCPTYPEGYYPDATAVETVSASDSHKTLLPVIQSDSSCCS